MFFVLGAAFGAFLVLSRGFGGLGASFLGSSCGMTLGLTKSFRATFRAFLVLGRAFGGLGAGFLGTSFGMTLGLAKGSGGCFWRLFGSR